MAKVPVILKIEGFKDREVASLTYSFNQTVDKDGQVTDIPRGGLIVVRVKAMNDGNTELFSWMAEKKQHKMGQIYFADSTSGNRMKAIFFWNAYCVNFVEHWEDTFYNAPLAHWEEITISCQTFKLENIIFENDWSVTGRAPDKKDPDAEQ